MDKEVRIEQYKAELDWIDTHLFENIDTDATRKFIKTKGVIEAKKLLRICELRDKENSPEKLKEKLQEIISRLERNRNAERLNSEATKEPTKSFWRGQAEKTSEVIIWLERLLKEAGEPK